MAAGTLRRIRRTESLAFATVGLMTSLTSLLQLVVWVSLVLCLVTIRAVLFRRTQICLVHIVTARAVLMTSFGGARLGTVT
jgi:hypothetical protein